MKIGDFQQIAQTQHDDKRLVQDSKTGDLKTSSFKGKVLSHFKGEAKTRNDQVKEAFIKSIKDAYGNDAAQSARQMIGVNGKALTVRDVKAVLDKHITIHRTHGESTGAHEKQVGLSSGMDKTITFLTKGGGNFARLPEFFQGLSSDEQTALKMATKEEMRPEVMRNSPGAPPDAIDKTVRLLKQHIGTETRAALQGGDIQQILIRSDEGGYGLDCELLNPKITPELLNKIVMATDDELAAAVKQAMPDYNNQEITDTVAKTRNHTPRVTLGNVPKNGLVVTTATIGHTKFLYDRTLGQGSFGAAHRMVSEDGSETLVVKQMLTSSNDDDNDKAVKLAEARVEVRAHDYALAEASDTTNLAKIRTALAGPDGTISIALESCEMGDTGGLFSGLAKTGKIEAASTGQVPDFSITQAQADSLKVLLAHDILSGMKALQEDCQMMHLDMKPENVFLGADGIAKIGDFGLARPALSATVTHDSFQTTPYYKAPEIDRDNSISTKTDSYALGMMIYRLEQNKVPFFDDDTTGFTSQMEKAHANWYSATGTDASGKTTYLHNGLAEGKYATGNAELDGLVNALTHPDPEQRITMSDALEMPYFANLPANGSQEMQDLRALLVTVADIELKPSPTASKSPDSTDVTT